MRQEIHASNVFIRMAPALREKLNDMAEQESASVSELARQMIREGIERRSAAANRNGDRRQVA